MSSSVAKYSFLPYVRLGLGNQITEIDVLGSFSGATIVERPEVDVSFSVKATGRNLPETKEPISRKVKIEGPGDVLGIQPNQIIRVNPAGGVDNFETNNLAYVEFYEEDFPWRYTPAKPSGSMLRPWLALIVLKETEFQRNTQGGTPTPFIRIAASALQAVFYPQTELHFFAHVHVLETLDDNITTVGTATSEVRETIQNNPDLALSRIMCPRKLEPSILYHAFLVPAYETGRLAGLGQDTAAVVAQRPSWNRDAPGNADMDMPYYYTWNFKTSPGGDFETLVQKLEVRDFPGNTGREMDLSAPGLGLKPEGDDATALVEGALKSLNHSTPPWPVDEADLQNQLRDILNLNETLRNGNPVQPGGVFYSPDVLLDPIVTPPIYGRWHAQIDALNANSDWVHQLNLHPSHRAAAGLGTRVVQEHQEEFMEMAWNQIGAINEANQKIIENEVVKRTSERLYRKNIRKMDQFLLMNTIGKAMEVLPIDTNLTAKKTLKDSRVPTAFRTGTFTRVANNFTRTALMDRTGQDGTPAVLNQALLDRTNANANSNESGVSPISAAPKRKIFEIQLDPVILQIAINAVLENPPVSFMVALTDAIAAKGVNFQNADVIASLPSDYNQSQINRALDILSHINSRDKTNDKLTLKISSSVFEARISNKYDKGEFDVTNGPVNNIKIVCFEKSTTLQVPVLFFYSDILQSRDTFKTSFNDAFLNENSKAEAFIKEQKTPLQNDFRQKILAGFHPKHNFRRKLTTLLETNAPITSKPLMAYPRFPIPVYDYLKAISPDYIIPNISNIPANTIALMQPNKVFIESFLAGMNHEFSRELLWREFPTDMRGSYFRHFWEYDNDPSNEMLPLPTESETDFHNRIIAFQDAAADVKELHNWKNSLLGNNHSRTFGLILLIKGDLFRKYPDTMVYAQKAKFKSGDGGKLPRELTDYNDPANVQWPVITGMITPDVYFFGFELTESEAKGNLTTNPGWFFVLRERPGQISFGLDELSGSLTPPQDWDDLTWQHLSGNANTVPQYLKILGAPFNPKTFDNITWGNSSAQTAYILYQDPILYAKHASLFL